MFQSLLFGMGRVLAYFYSLIPSYGIAIIMLTVLVRIAMIPLAIKQAHSMRANRGNAERMRKLAPEVKRIREKYKDDRQRQYEEQKKLYADHEVNMFGGLSGCLPLLLQAPIFLAMYAVLQGCDRLFTQSCEPGYHIPNDSPLHRDIVEHTATFLGTNLGYRPAEVFGQIGPLEFFPYILLIGVMGGTMWLQTSMMMKLQPAPDPQFAQMQKIMKFMPLMLVVFSWNFPAGLILYWSASNVWTIGQQFILNKKYGPGSEPEKGAEGKGGTTKDGPGKGGTAKDGPAKSESPPAGRPKGSGARKGGGAKGARSRNSGGKPPPAKGGQGGSSGGSRAKPPAQRPKPQSPRKEAPGGQSPRKEAPGGQSPRKEAPQRGTRSGATGGSGKSGETTPLPRRPAARRARPGASGKRDPGGPGGGSASAQVNKSDADRGPDKPAAPGRPKDSGARKGNRGDRK